MRWPFHLRGRRSALEPVPAPDRKERDAPSPVVPPVGTRAWARAPRLVPVIRLRAPILSSFLTGPDVAGARELLASGGGQSGLGEVEGPPIGVLVGFGAVRSAGEQQRQMPLTELKPRRRRSDPQPAMADPSAGETPPDGEQPFAGEQPVAEEQPVLRRRRASATTTTRPGRPVLTSVTTDSVGAPIEPDRPFRSIGEFERTLAEMEANNAFGLAMLGGLSAVTVPLPPAAAPAPTPQESVPRLPRRSLAESRKRGFNASSPSESPTEAAADRSATPATEAQTEPAAWEPEPDPSVQSGAPLAPMGVEPTPHHAVETSSPPDHESHAEQASLRPGPIFAPGPDSWSIEPAGAPEVEAGSDPGAARAGRRNPPDLTHPSRVMHSPESVDDQSPAADQDRSAAAPQREQKMPPEQTGSADHPSPGRDDNPAATGTSPDRGRPLIARTRPVVLGDVTAFPRLNDTAERTVRDEPLPSAGIELVHEPRGRGTGPAAELVAPVDQVMDSSPGIDEPVPESIAPEPVRLRSFDPPVSRGALIAAASPALLSVETREPETVLVRVPAEVARPVGARLGVSVDDVPVLRGRAVGARATAVSARAFSAGGVVYLPDEAGDLAEPGVQALLAHELVHVAQQHALGAELPLADTLAGQQLEDSAVRTEQWFRSQEGSPAPLVHRRSSGAGGDPAGSPEQLQRATVEMMPFALPSQRSEGDGWGPLDHPELPDPSGHQHQAELPIRPPEPFPAGHHGSGFEWQLTERPAGHPASADTAVLDRLDRLEGAIGRIRADLDSDEERDDLLARLDDPRMLSRLAERLYTNLRHRLRAELLIDRERHGALADFR